MIVVVLEWLLQTIGKVLAVTAGLWLYKEVTMGICRTTKDLTGKVAVVTGASAGLGLQTTLLLAKKGCRVILGCRNLAKAQQAVQYVKSKEPGAELEIVELQLAKLKSVKRFADEVARLTDEVHLLVNNAGVFYIEEEKLGQALKKHTEDGLELAVGTNFFGHVYLSNCLMKLLRNGGKDDDPSRIINLSSFGHMQGKLNAEDLDLNANQRLFDPSYQYCASKMAIIQWSNKLAKELVDSNVISVSVNPGLVRTSIFDNTPKRVQAVMAAALWILGKNAEQGAQTIMHAALSEDHKNLNGKYLADCRVERLFISGQVGNHQVEDCLWDYTHDLLKSITD